MEASFTAGSDPTTMSSPQGPRDIEGQRRAPRRRFSKWRAIYDGARERERRRREEAAGFRDSSAMYWELYASEAELSDQKLVQTLTGDTKSMVILNSIFSSIVASFIIQTSQALQPNNSQETVCLLSQLVSPGDPTQPSSRFCPGPYPAVPSEAAVRSNILLFISFFLSMMSVLACALIQQWCREFMTCAHYRGVPSKRARVRTYLLQGFHQFHMRGFVKGVHVILHVSVFLFFCGVSVYLHDVYPRVGMIAWYCTFVLGAVYITFSIFPLIIRNCPFHTALTSPLRLCRTLLDRTILRFGRSTFLWRGQGRTLPRHHFYKMDSLEAEAHARAAQLDTYAMKWLFLDNDIGDTDMDKFLEGLPGYIQSHSSENEELPGVLTAPFILRRIMEHLLTCATATELSEQARIKRLSACVDSLEVIFRQRARDTRPMNSDEERSIRKSIQSIVDRLNTACEKPDEIWDLPAFCVRALIFQEFLTRLLEPVRESSPDVPGHFIPLYAFFSSVLSQTPQDTGPPHAGAFDRMALPNEDNDGWRLLLNDGPLINLTLLARAILSNDDIDPSSLSMCWKTLDKLRSEFRITRTDVSSSSLALFNETHEATRRRVENNEPGFSVIPLLEIFDAVAGGRRLSIVFQDHPTYDNKADLVFGKDHLRDPDLFRAFANCFPHFFTNHHEKSMEFTESLVCFDDLWTSLRVNLRKYFSHESSSSEKLRTFDSCCVVMDAAFTALEDSLTVDWRASNFEELTQYFDLVVADYTRRNMPIESATDFRISLIKARLCRAVLAQFLDQFKSEGIVVLQAPEDVASLARISYSLGIVDDTDVEFWKSFVDGGLVSPVVMAKTRTMLHKAERDGPLLNFCKLGRLGLMAVGFRGSGLKDTDFEELLGLMQKMTEDPRLPLTHASTPVLEEFRQLRDEVVDVCRSSHNEDKANMQALLAKFDEVHRRHQECRPSDHVLAQASGTSAVVQPNPPSRGSIPGNDRSGFTRTSTALIGDPLNISPSLAHQVDARGITLSPPNSSRVGFANVYPTPHPHILGQILPRGGITRPPFLPTLPSRSGSIDVTSQRIHSSHPPSPHMHYLGQRRHSSFYDHLRGYPTPPIWASRLATPLPTLPPIEMPSPSGSNIAFGSSNDQVFSSSPVASSGVGEIE